MIHTPEFQPYQPRRACPWCRASAAHSCSFAFITYVLGYDPKRELR